MENVISLSKYVNYGDENPLDYDGFWIKQDYSNPTCYSIVKITNRESVLGIQENKRYLLEEGCIDLSEDWINWEYIYNYADIDENASNINKVIAAISYYTILDFGTYKEVDNKLEALEFLEEHDIELEQSSKEYKEEVESNTFSLINEVAMALGSRSFFEDETEEEKENKKLYDEIDNTSDTELCEKFKYDEDAILLFLEEHFNVRF